MGGLKIFATEAQSKEAALLEVYTVENSVLCEGSGSGLVLGNEAMVRLHRGERLTVKRCGPVGYFDRSYLGHFYLALLPTCGPTPGMFAALSTVSPGTEVEVTLLEDLAAGAEAIQPQECGQMAF